MRVSELLTAIANELESSENEALLLSEYDEECMNVVANSLVEAAAVLKKAAEQVEIIEPEADSTITPESIEEIAALSSALDSSDDPQLKKQASVLDELLLTIAAPKNAIKDKKAEEDKRLQSLKEKYHDVGETLKKDNKTAEQEKDVSKSEWIKNMPIQGHALKQRNCPDHPGTGTFKLEGSDSTYVCSLDHKHYDYENGYTLMSGEKVPGGSVAAQTGNGENRFYAPLYDNRDGRLNNH